MARSRGRRLSGDISNSSRLALLALSGLLLWLCCIILCCVSEIRGNWSRGTYIVIRLVLIIMILALIVLLVILILKVTLLKIIIKFLKLKSLACEPIDGTWNQLLLDVLSELVIKLKALLDVAGGVIIVLVSWGLWWREEVEEGLCRNSLLDNTGLLGVCEIC